MSLQVAEYESRISDLQNELATIESKTSSQVSEIFDLNTKVASLEVCWIIVLLSMGY